MSEPFNLDLFAARWLSGTTPPESIPQLAADALEAGFDGPALRQVAGLVKPTLRDLGDLRQDAFRELGSTRIVTYEDALFLLSRVTALDIIEGRIEPIRGSEVLAKYASMLCYPEFISQFLELSEMPRWGEYAPRPETIVELIMAQAREVLAHVPE